MLDWIALNAKLSRFLQDDLNPDAGKTTYLFPLELRIDAWNWAQSLFCNHTARECSTMLKIEADGRTAQCPDDFKFMGMIYDKNGELAPDYRNVYTRREFVEGGLRMDTLNYNWSYWIWAGLIHFDKPQSNNIAYAMDYFAAWPDLTYDGYDANGNIVMVQDKVYVPKWAELPLAHLAAATCLMPGSISAAMANEFRIRIDAGTPLDNPREQEARSHAWWYDYLLGKVPPQARAVGAIAQ